MGDSAGGLPQIFDWRAGINWQGFARQFTPAIWDALTFTNRSPSVRFFRHVTRDPAPAAAMLGKESSVLISLIRIARDRDASRLRWYASLVFFGASGEVDSTFLGTRESD
jgi:hypothetical protein